tara:strand:+ start:267 stop:491 length:225 start_codon:yes stop_codon:yes gene_type:complete
MKTFEIEVVRAYTTTIEVALPDNLTPSAVERITQCIDVDTADEDDIFFDIWDVMAEAELEQMDVDMQSIKVKEL